MRKTLSITGLTVLIAAVLPGAALASGSVNTGLDPTLPLSAVVFDTARTAIDSTTTQSASRVALRVALNHDQEVDVVLPYRDSLSVAKAGAVCGPGDLGLRYARVLRAGNFREAAGASFTLPTGAGTFSAGADTIAPFAAFAYTPRPWVTLVVSPSFQFSAKPKPGYPDTQALALDSSVVANLPYGFYGAVGLRDEDVRGTYRYGERLMRFTVGNLVRNRLNASFYVQAPAASKFTYTHVERAEVGFSLSMQR